MATVDFLGKNEFWGAGKGLGVLLVWELTGYEGLTGLRVDRV